MAAVRWLRIDGRRLRPAKIVCVARNYAAHAKESGSEVPADPVFFLKPTTALIPSGGTILLPPESIRVEEECELAVVLGKRGRDVPPGRAMDLVLGYAVILDITARDLQARARSEGLPWTAAKGFDTFAPVSDITPAEKVGDPHRLAIRLEVNGEPAQVGNTRDMVHKVPDLISRASRIMTLERGDLLATGTPAGVREIRDGDVLVGTIERVGRVEARVARKV
jgi:2-keto-4-pentenoate hydratase/2-oxohepta-3-ene-1,7-dioic acid hydratase in catechol pathway